MAEILVTELEEWVLLRLEERARRSGRSVEDETLAILQEALGKEEAPQRRFGSETVALFSGQGVGLEGGEEIAEIRGMRMGIPKFEP